MAQVPTGTFNYVFTNTPLYDASGTYTNAVDTNDFTDTVIADITVAANGSVTGERQDQIVEGENTADIHGTITGKTSDKGGVVSGKLKETGTVTGVFDGEDYTGTAKGSSIVTLDISSSSSNVVDAGSVTINVKGHKSVTFAGSGTTPLRDSATGHWTLDNDITAAGDKLSGTGMVTLDNGRVFTNEITGTYSTKTGIAKLKLVGVDDAAGSGLSMTTTGTNMDLTALKGKILGQTPTILP
jgi:hypothetical protein